MYKVVDSNLKSLYEVFCYFDSDGAWTLVHSCSFANGLDNQLKKSLSQDLHVGGNALVWSGYRLKKTRMESIKESSTFLQFTWTMKNTVMWKNWTMFKFGLEI
jgi:hypothetical protein